MIKKSVYVGVHMCLCIVPLHVIASCEHMLHQVKFFLIRNRNDLGMYIGKSKHENAIEVTWECKQVTSVREILVAELNTT